LAVLVDKFSQILPPDFRYRWVILGGIGFCAVISGIWAFAKRPSREEAAAAIDEKLRLKEKFSTAIYVRPSSDPFAMAAVRDAEKTAENVNLGRQFPIPFPKPAYTMALLALCAFLLAQFVTPLSLFGQK